MCVDPATIGAVVSVASLAMTAATQFSKQSDTAELYIDNGAGVNRSLAQTYNSNNARAIQEGDKAATESFDVVRGMAEAKGKAVAAAGEAGVEGVSFANILSDFEAREGRARGNIDGNYQMAVGQIQTEQEAARERAKSMIRATPRPDPTGMYATIGAEGLKTGLKIYDAFGDDATTKTTRKPSNNSYGPEFDR